MTDKKITDRRKSVTSNILDFSQITFGPEDDTSKETFSFETNIMPRTKRAKLKSKKFTFWKLILELESTGENFTVTEVVVPVRFTGLAK